MRIQVSGVGVSCAHFIEINGSFETLHGHNIIFSAEAEGTGEGGIVMDFRELEDHLECIASKIDHRLLIPEKNPGIEISSQDGYTEIRAGPKRYLVPSGDLVLLPLINSTAEEIGRWVFSELSKKLPEEVNLRSVSVQEVEGKVALVES